MDKVTCNQKLVPKVTKNWSDIYQFFSDNGQSELACTVYFFPGHASPHCNASKTQYISTSPNAQIIHFYSCNGKNIFMSSKMECSIQRGLFRFLVGLLIKMP